MFLREGPWERHSIYQVERPENIESLVKCIEDSLVMGVLELDDYGIPLSLRLVELLEFEKEIIVQCKQGAPQRKRVIRTIGRGVEWTICVLVPVDLSKSHPREMTERLIHSHDELLQEGI